MAGNRQDFLKIPEDDLGDAFPLCVPKQAHLICFTVASGQISCADFPIQYKSLFISRESRVSIRIMNSNFLQFFQDR